MQDEHEIKATDAGIPAVLTAASGPDDGVETYDEVVAARELEIADKQRFKWLWRVGLLLLVVGYLAVLYRLYHEIPSYRTLYYLVFILIAIWTTDSADDPHADDVIDRWSFIRIGISVKPVLTKTTKSIMNVSAWIALCLVMLLCRQDILHHIADPYDRMSSSERTKAVQQKQREDFEKNQKIIEEFRASHPD